MSYLNIIIHKTLVNYFKDYGPLKGGKIFTNITYSRDIGDKIFNHYTN